MAEDAAVESETTGLRKTDPESCPLLSYMQIRFVIANMWRVLIDETYVGDMSCPDEAVDTAIATWKSTFTLHRTQTLTIEDDTVDYRVECRPGIPVSMTVLRDFPTTSTTLSPSAFKKLADFFQPDEFAGDYAIVRTHGVPTSAERVDLFAVTLDDAFDGIMRSVRRHAKRMTMESYSEEHAPMERRVQRLGLMQCMYRVHVIGVDMACDVPDVYATDGHVTSDANVNAYLFDF